MINSTKMLLVIPLRLSDLSLDFVFIGVHQVLRETPGEVLVHDAPVDETYPSAASVKYTQFFPVKKTGEESAITKPSFRRYAAFVIPAYLVVSAFLLFAETTPAPPDRGMANSIVATGLVVLSWPFYLLSRFSIETVVDLPDYVFVAIDALAWLAGGFFWAWLFWMIPVLRKRQEDRIRGGSRE